MCADRVYFAQSKATSYAPSKEDAALVALVGTLIEQRYHFTTVTPLTQARVNARNENRWATDLAGVFGWSRPFSLDVLPRQIVELMQAADVLATDSGGNLRASIRVSTLGTQFFVHSAYPTIEPDSVFFGPDTVRFVQAIARSIERRTTPLRRVADIGCGAGPGGITISASEPNADVLMLDINAKALRYARVNATINRVTAQACQSDILKNTSGCFDLIVSNPPYLIDGQGRAYRHGGGQLGEGLSFEILTQSLPRLSSGGTLLMYTGAAVVGGVDAFAESCRRYIQLPQFRWSYVELDPDVFGEELEAPAYRNADRIAAVLLTATNVSST